MQCSQWELFLAQMGSSRRYVVAFFDTNRVVVQMSNIVEHGEGSDIVELERCTRCTLESVPSELWSLFKSQVSDDKSKSSFSFKENIHVNVRVKDAHAIQAFCFVVKDSNSDTRFEDFQSFFNNVVSNLL